MPTILKLRYVLIRALVVIVFAVASGDTYALDLKYSDLEKMTMDGNGSIAAGELRWRAQDKRTRFFWKSLAPKFDLAIGQEIFRTGVYGNKNQPYGNVAVTVNLFNGFRDLNEGQLRNAQAALTKVQSSVTTQEKLSVARLLYLQLAYGKELGATYEAVQKMNDRVRKSALLRQNRGLVTSTDLYEFDIYGSRLKEEIEGLRHERLILSIRLSAALGIDRTNDINPIDPLGHDHDEDLVKRDFTTVATAGMLKISSEDSVHIAEASYRASWWMPSVDAYAGYYVYTLRERDYLAFRDRDDWVAGVRASWSLFDFELFSQSKAAAFEEKASAVDRKQKSRDFNADVRALQEDLIHIHELIHNAEERVKLGDQYLKSTQNDYDRGVKNSPDVISAIDKLIAIRKELLDRKLEYHRIRDRIVSLTQEI